MEWSFRRIDYFNSSSNSFFSSSESESSTGAAGTLISGAAGIGGAGMIGIARVLLKKGYKVSTFDSKKKPLNLIDKKALCDVNVDKLFLMSLR